MPVRNKRAHTLTDTGVMSVLRGAVVQWYVGRSLITPAARVQFPGWEARIIRCKNLALYIRDCESVCLSDAWGSKISHTGGKCVTCRGLHILT